VQRLCQIKTGSNIGFLETNAMTLCCIYETHSVSFLKTVLFLQQ